MEKAFKLELRNRFSALDNTDTADHDNIQEKWNTIMKAYAKAVVNTVRYRTKENKDWLTSETWKHIEEIKKHKAKNDKQQINKAGRTTEVSIYNKGQRNKTKCKKRQENICR